MSNPWSFFKNVYVISLKEATERRVLVKKTLDSIPDLSYTIIDGVNGKKNPHLRKSLKDRNIIGEFTHGDGILGCLASHRMLWERILYDCESLEPSWTLILEDDIAFHPLFTSEHLRSYLQAVPSDAWLLKFGYLATPPYSSKYIPVNRYWTSFQNTPSFAFLCYAVHSDLIPHLLKHTWTQPVDTLSIPRAYGAVNLEQVLDDDTDYSTFRNYYNPYIKAVEQYHGFVAANVVSESQTFEEVPPTAKKRSVIHVVTLCTGYEYPIYERFAGSLYDTGFTGNVYFIVLPSDMPKIKTLQETYPNVKAIVDTSERKTHFQSHRYGVLRSHLDDISSYDYLLLCDARDVLFQKNPEEYKLKQSADIIVFEEEWKISQCPYNSRWMKDLGSILKKEMYASLADKPIICSGTTFCSSRSIRHYLDSMVEVVTRPEIPMNYIMDQGAHIYLYYYDKFKPYSVLTLTNNDNFVNTIGIGFKSVNDENRIVNKNGDISYIVHQYDRMSPEQRKQISVKYDFTL